MLPDYRIENKIQLNILIKLLVILFFSDYISVNGVRQGNNVSEHL